MGIEITSGFDSQLTNSLQGVEPWVKSSMTGMVAASYILGAICAFPFIPAFNDRFGHRWSIMFGSMVSVLGVIIQGLSVHVGMYIIARMLLGFGIPFCIIAGSTMLGEMGYSKERPIRTSLFNASYFIDSISAAAITMATNYILSDWSWRIPPYLQMAPSLIQISLVMLLPESPRYLISKDCREEAFDILSKYHVEGDRNNLIVIAEMAQIETTITLELEAANMTWIDLIKTAGMRNQWPGNTLISYYFFTIRATLGVADAKVKQGINLGKEAWFLINAITIAMIVTRFKRSKMYLLCTSCMLAVYFSWTICQGIYVEAEKEHKLNPTLPLNKPAYNIGFNSLTYTYLIGLFSYAERTRGLAFFQFFGQGATFFATFVNPIRLANISWRWLIVYCAWVEFEIVVIYFFFPQTYNRTLEELSFLFEGQDMANKQVVAVEKQIHSDLREMQHEGAEHVEPGVKKSRLR
ncbi:general substrate transporter [Calycina marina]|uniref:General substrate transporter n=1 Tax=Calycina marina TaxID=1763456 RepID=A0A9P8CI47_9HELO|nr:general substrate transporter [Calycina marina]